ncbi:hypothetical protein MFIFM68171_07891 [Madurella fahalii]|uniref:Amino acid transporter n=1 Tax=Madurella fahalii TaxID=1157608 RepID=A0ABQ0GIV0_9PEZI
METQHTQPEQEPPAQTLQDQGHLADAQAAADASPETTLINRALSPDQLLSPFTVFCLIVNRTIASGIFTQPYNVLKGVGNPGASLLVWFSAGIIVLCITACWVELGLSIPRHVVGQHYVSTPKSGGDKNYLEYIFKKPHLMISCVFGIAFIIFGNLAGNAIQFGVFMQAVIDPTCQDGCVQRGPVVAWAIFALSICAFINIATRKFSILLNNIFAVCKVLLVILMVFIGIIYGSTHNTGCRQITWENKGEGGDFGDVVLALFYATYPYTGYEQPFYVLAEVKQPKRLFGKSVMYTMSFFILLYTLVNTSYLCMNPYLGTLPSTTNIITNPAIAFFYTLSSNANQDATTRAISIIIALFILGNLLAQTYTASRVKQEIAKEGILPYSLLLAKSKDTLFARFFPSSTTSTTQGGRKNAEQAPFAATILHLSIEIFLVLVVGLTLSPNKAYNFLTYIYTYIIVGILGFLTVVGLLGMKIDSLLRPRAMTRGEEGGGNGNGKEKGNKKKGRGWDQKREWAPVLDPLPCVVAVVGLAVMLFGAFLSPSKQEANEVVWWVNPLVGWLCFLAGVAWWGWLELRQWLGGYRLESTRIVFVEKLDDQDPVQTAEMVRVRRRYKSQMRPVDNALSGGVVREGDVGVG